MPSLLLILAVPEANEAGLLPYNVPSLPRLHLVPHRRARQNLDSTARLRAYGDNSVCFFQRLPVLDVVIPLCAHANGKRYRPTWKLPGKALLNMIAARPLHDMHCIWCNNQRKHLRKHGGAHLSDQPQTRAISVEARHRQHSNEEHEDFL